MSVARPARSLLGKCVASTGRSPISRSSSSSSSSSIYSAVAAAAAASCIAQRGAFHTSTARPKKQQRARCRNVTAKEMGLLDDKNLQKFKQEHFADYTKEEIEALKKRYTPEQMESIMAGEKAVDPEDMIFQGRFREDPHRPNYIEDYTVLDPRYDLMPEAEGEPREVQWLNESDWADKYGDKMAALTGKKTDHQLTRAMARALLRVKESHGQEYIDLTHDELQDLEKNPELLAKYLVAEDGDAAAKETDLSAAKSSDVLTKAQALALDEAIDREWKKELDALSQQLDPVEVEPTNLELIEDGPAGPIRMHSAEAPELGKVPGVAGLYKSAADPEDEGQDDDGRYQEIKRLTGMSLKDIQSIYRKVLVTRWVSNQTRLGKVRSTSVVAIAGNGNGRLGLGIAKSTEAGLAAETAQLLAIRNMKPIRRYENRTIFGKVKAKVSGTVVELFARPPGFGLRCPHRIFEMCRAAGIHDIASNMPRNKNPMNSVKATYEALTNQIDPEEIAIGRGKKMVDVRKVYYGGSVH